MNRWYKVEADFNLSEKTYNVTITGPDGVEHETRDVPSEIRHCPLSARYACNAGQRLTQMRILMISM